MYPDGYGLCGWVWRACLPARSSLHACLQAVDSSASRGLKLAAWWRSVLSQLQLDGACLSRRRMYLNVQKPRVVRGNLPPL